MDPDDNKRTPPRNSFLVLFIGYVLSIGSITIVFATSDSYTMEVGLTEADYGWFSGLSLGLPCIISAAASFLWDYVVERVGFRETFLLMNATCGVANLMCETLRLFLSCLVLSCLVLSCLVLAVLFRLVLFSFYVVLASSLPSRHRWACRRCRLSGPHPHLALDPRPWNI